VENPFKSEMVKMKLPDGSHMHIGGYLLEADKDGCVEFPRRLVSEASAHGLTPVDEKAPAKK
jgi:hypothetical protein